MPLPSALPLLKRTRVAAATCCVLGLGCVAQAQAGMLERPAAPLRGAGGLVLPGQAGGHPAPQMSPLPLVGQVAAFDRDGRPGAGHSHNPRHSPAPHHAMDALPSASPVPAEPADPDSNSYPALALGAVAALALVGRRRLPR